MSKFLFTFLSKIEDLLKFNHFSPYIVEKMRWTSCIEWSSDISLLSEADFQAYNCTANELYMLLELQKFVIDYITKNPDKAKPVARPAQAEPPPKPPWHRDRTVKRLAELKRLA